MADETANAPKRALEEESNAAEDVPAVKKQKTDAEEAPQAAAAAGDGEEAQPPGEDTAAGDAENAEAAEDAGEAGAEDAAMDEDAPANGAAAAAGGGPVKLGYRTFANSREAADYLQDVLKKAIPHRKLNEYESLMLLDLLQKGHPHAADKLGGGVRAFVVAERRVDGNTTICFHVKRLDNSLEDFSYRKCLQALFPDYVLSNPQNDRQDKGRGRGGRGGRGGGGRFGGRGRGGGGGGRGRGGRGRGGRS